MPIQITRIKSITPAMVQAFERLLPQLAPNVPQPTLEQWEEILANANNYVLLAHEGDDSTLSSQAILGSLTLALYRTPSGLHAWIEDVVVDVTARGRGIGEALCRAALDIAQQAGAHGVSLTSRPTREAANRLYQRMGFVQRQTNVYLFSFES